MAAVANLEFRLGETWPIDATMHDSFGAVLPIAAPVAVKWRLALNGVVVTELTIGSGINRVGDGSTGECIITLTPAQQGTLKIKPTWYSHECQVVLADGSISDQFYGNLHVLPSLFPPP
jgi:hypothetical protein